MQDEAVGPGGNATEAATIALAGGTGGFADAEFASLLLRALIDMAARSKRRQADVLAALRGAGVAAEPGRVRAALRTLLAQGFIADLVPLSDGGLLLTVTTAATERVEQRPQWLPLAEDG